MAAGGNKGGDGGREQGAKVRRVRGFRPCFIRLRATRLKVEAAPAHAGRRWSVAAGPVAESRTGLAIAGLVLGWGAVIFGVIVAVIAIVAGTYAATHGMGGMRMP